MNAAPKIVIIGGVAGGASAAARARRLAEHAEIVVFERGPHASFANCGLPYYLGGEIQDRGKLLVAGSGKLHGWLNLDVRTNSDVVAIDRQNKTVEVRELPQGRVYKESYDYLILSPGATPLRPPALLEKVGAQHPRVLSLRNIPDVDRLKGVVDAGAKSAVVIGGGFIGLEVAEQLHRRGLKVAVVEMLPQVMPPVDPEMVTPVHETLTKAGIQLFLGDGVAALAEQGEKVTVKLKSAAAIEGDLVVLAIGVRPDTDLAKGAGVELNERGAIRVDAHLLTNDPHIYAVGDAIEVAEPILGGKTQIPLAGPANRQGRLAVDHLLSVTKAYDWSADDIRYRGSQGTSIVRVLDTTVAMTGQSEKSLLRAGQKLHADFDVVYVHPNQHAEYYPGAQRMTLKLIFAKPSGRILGAQCVGADGIDKRIDVIATAIQFRGTVFDLEQVELCYSPQFGSAKDPVNQAGFQAANVLRGLTAPVTPADIEKWRSNPATADFVLLDVRTAKEHAAGSVAGALHIPIEELRARIAEVPRGKPIVTYCAVGMRGYLSERILRQRGFTKVHNLSGGFRTWQQFHPPK